MNLVEHHTPLAIFFEVAALIALAMAFVIVKRAWPTLPDQVPQHFGITGAPDAWGKRRIAWTGPVVGAGAWVVLTLSGYAAMQRDPRAAMLSELIAGMKACMMVTMAMISHGIVEVAMKRASKLHPSVLIFTLLAPAILLAYIWMQYKLVP
jgi:uncharacterized membrane protein